MARVKDTQLPRRHTDQRIHIGHSASATDVNHDACKPPPGWKPTVADFQVACTTPTCPRYQVVGVIAGVWVNADGIVRMMCGFCGEWYEDWTQVAPERPIEDDDAQGEQ